MIPKKGHVFHGPDGQGYRVTRDCAAFDFITENLFDPVGGARKLNAGDPIPKWLAAQLYAGHVELEG